MEYRDWQITKNINYGNPLSKICIRSHNNSLVVEKKIVLTDLNEEYAKLQIGIMKDINSPHVAKYLGHFHDKQENAIYLYMPFYKNGDLEEYLLKNPKITFQRRMKIFIDVLIGLMELHSKFIIHRDLKLKNIFVDQNQECLVGDMGVATITEAEALSRLGTIGHQAPEVYSEDGYNQKVDMWAAGIIAYQIFNPLKAGKIPFPFDTHQALHKVLQKRAGGVDYKDYLKYTSKIQPFDESVPPKLAELISSMLSNIPEKRIGWIEFYQSQVLTEYDTDLRTASFLLEYKSMANTKQYIQKIKNQMLQTQQLYYQKLSVILSDNNIQFYLKKYNDLAKNKREVHLFFYIELRKILLRYDYIKQKKFNRLIIELKPFIKKVREAHHLIEQRINIWLREQHQPEIQYNTQYLENQYRQKVKIIVDKILSKIQ